MRIDGLFHCHTGSHADGVRQGKVTMDFYFSDSAGGDGADVSVCDGGLRERLLAPFSLGVPASIRGMLSVEDPASTFDPGLYVLTDELRALDDRVATLRAAQGALSGRGIDYRASVLLSGPSGVGKTEYARHLAAACGLPLATVSFARLIGGALGKTGSNLADVFGYVAGEECILFLDEVDAVAVSRSRFGDSSAGKELQNTTIVLMQLLDSLPPGTLTLAATNRPQDLDPALLRPGRFDRRVTVDRPDVRGREKILRVHAENKPFAESVDFERLAKITPGFTGADLANLCNEAALLAARRRRACIGPDEVEEAMERVMAGPERKSRVITEKERKTIAYHESGHAMVGHVLENSDPIHKISIIARGQALGYTMQVPEEDHFLQTREGMLDQIAVLLGGRTAEEIFCDDITTGASNDLERATKLAREMVTRYGMSEELGTQVFGEAQHEVFLGRDYAQKNDFSAETAKRIDDEIERIMREAHDRAREVLADRVDQMDTMARVLLERETVEGPAVDALLNGTWDEYEASEKK